MSFAFHKDVKIEFDDNKKYILVYLKNILFYKQDYIKNKMYTLFLVILILSRYGLVYIKNKDVCI